VCRGAIFFDLGNTLATGLGESVRRILGFRLSLSEREVKRVGRLVMTCPAMEPAALAAALEPILPNHGPGAVDDAVRSLWIEQEESVREVPGAFELLVDLKKRGFHLGVLSNTWHPFILGFRCSCDRISGLVDHWLLSYVIGDKKPAGGLFDRAVAESGFAPSQCWMVGDSYELDVAPALKAGMKTVWLVVKPERERGAIARILRGELQKPTWASEDLQALGPFLLGE
jgi:HAD superfamily hydrolase (TIGR01509 family)